MFRITNFCPLIIQSNRKHIDKVFLSVSSIRNESSYKLLQGNAFAVRGRDAKTVPRHFLQITILVSHLKIARCNIHNLTQSIQTSKTMNNLYLTQFFAKNRHKLHKKITKKIHHKILYIFCVQLFFLQQILYTIQDIQKFQLATLETVLPDQKVFLIISKEIPTGEKKVI